jgi:hypothetical protein
MVLTQHGRRLSHCSCRRAANGIGHAAQYAVRWTNVQVMGSRRGWSKWPARGGCGILVLEEDGAWRWPVCGGRGWGRRREGVGSRRRWRMESAKGFTIDGASGGRAAALSSGESEQERPPPLPRASAPPASPPADTPASAASTTARGLRSLASVLSPDGSSSHSTDLEGRRRASPLIGASGEVRVTRRRPSPPSQH